MRTMLVAAAVALAALATAAAQPKNPMRPGRYEITMQMEMPGMPMKMPAQKVTQCITQQQLDDPNAAVPGAPGGKNPCKVSNHKVDGNKISWDMTCSDPQEMTGSGEMVVSGDTYTGTMKMNMPQGQMSMTYNAKRLGECEP